MEDRFGPLTGEKPVGGGCVNQAARLDLAHGSMFLKYNTAAPPSMFSAEASGLERLRAVGAGLRIPEVIGFRDSDEGGMAWLALEWLEAVRRPADFGERLGRGLAAIHQAPQEHWGLDEDGFIGPLPQSNRPLTSWAEFWWSQRLEPQLAASRSGGGIGAPGDWDRLAASLPTLLATGEADGPSLLHGDLWGGNVLSAAPGDPALIDPAVYRGHREVDLSMTELFGGFDPGFHAAYREVWPLGAGYEEVRRDVYQLYFLLVHVNLFGGGYIAQTAATLRRALAAA